MTEIVAIDAELAERAAEYMHRCMSRRIQVAEWLRLFRYPWFPNRPASGWALMDHGQIVGVLGCVFSRREIEGRDHVLANICAWHVTEAYRQHSMGMLFTAMADRTVTITNLTPSPAIERVFVALGYGTLDTHKLFYFPLLRLRSLFGREGVEIRVGAGAVGQAVGGAARRVFTDHRDTIVEHFLITQGTRQCYLVARRRIKKKVRFAEVLYISDPGLFVDNFERTMLAILRRLRAPFLAFDRRFVPNPPRGALRVRRRSFILSKTLQPKSIDNLYTELCLLPA